MKTYSGEPEKIKNEKGWNYLRVHIILEEDGLRTEIGSYIRNYPQMYHSFYPFTLGGQEYALYSTHYSATRIMELPSCRDLGGEEPAGAGFCPTEFYVPRLEDREVAFGFVSGCVWADDSSWKVQFLDLTQIDRGVMARDDRFGYFELPRGIALKDAIVIDEDDGLLITIATPIAFRADTDGKVTHMLRRETGEFGPAPDIHNSVRTSEVRV